MPDKVLDRTLPTPVDPGTEMDTDYETGTFGCRNTGEHRHHVA